MANASAADSPSGPEPEPLRPRATAMLMPMTLPMLLLSLCPDAVLRAEFAALLCEVPDDTEPECEPRDQLMLREVGSIELRPLSRPATFRYVPMLLPPPPPLLLLLFERTDALQRLQARERHEADAEVGRELRADAALRVRRRRDTRRQRRRVAEVAERRQAGRADAGGVRRRQRRAAQCRVQTG